MPILMRSPPRGRFSHLAMFRLGSLLFIPAYASVTIYRIFASADQNGNFLLMTRMSRLCFKSPITHILYAAQYWQSARERARLFMSHHLPSWMMSSAIRYCGATFSYTSVAILLNYSKIV